MKWTVRLLYLYLFSFVGLLITVLGAIRLVDLGLKIYVFQNADMYSYTARPLTPEGKSLPPQEEAKEQERMIQEQKQENKRQRQRTAAEAIAMILIGAPLYLYHWSLVAKEDKGKRKK